MKKILMLLVAVCLLIPATAMADNNDKKAAKRAEKERKERVKENKKESKKVLKQFEKEGWKVLGSTRTLESMLMRHYEKLDEGGADAREVVGIATKVKSKNVGKQMAATNAAITYVQEYSEMRGRMLTDVTADGSMSESEFEHFYSAFEREVQKDIKGELTESFSIIRENGNGIYEVQTFFVLNENSATKARLRSLENALKESEAAQKQAERISAFVRGEK